MIEDPRKVHREHTHPDAQPQKTIFRGGAYIWVMTKSTQHKDVAEGSLHPTFPVAQFSEPHDNPRQTKSSQLGKSLPGKPESSCSCKPSSSAEKPPERSVRNRESSRPQLVEVQTSTEIREIERAEFEAILNCKKPGCCAVESVPGSALDQLAKQFNVAGAAAYGVCCTNASVAALEAVGVSALLIEHLVLEVAARPFPLTKSRLKKLKPIAGLFLRQAAKKTDLDLTELPANPEDTGMDLLRAKKNFSISENLATAFWRRASTIDKTIIRDWAKELVENPDPLIRYLQDQQIAVVIAVNWALLDLSYRELLLRISARHFRVVIVADPRAEHVDPWRSLDKKAVHRHGLSVSADRSVQVLSALAGTDAGSGRKAFSLNGSKPDQVPANTDIYPSREKLIAALGTGLAQIGGLTPKKSSFSSSPCDLGIDDLCGKSVLLVVHDKAEAIEFKRLLRNYIAEPVEVTGNLDLWKAKLKVLCMFLDPLGYVSGDKDNSYSAAISTLESILHAMSSQFFPDGKIPEDFERAIRVSHNLSGNHDYTAEPLEIYNGLVEKTVAGLSAVGSRGGPEVAVASKKTSAVLNHHVALLAHEREDTTKELIQLAHEVFDLRALGYEQAASGSQRWYVWASTYRERGGDRLDVAAHLERQRENPWRGAADLVAPNEHTGAVFVTHIQRLGNDVADHVIICRTSGRHMPYTGSHGDRPDPIKEKAVFYRAVASARESVHMLSIDERPFYLKPIHDHRGVPTTDS